ncbi:PadR family transcriptional regulator [Brevibacillus reuszeri]|uniref:PadR family transcriptional regulator n=1 Tax=Brevibacillus reuszeri TaxID=54915 RepID=A0A0K9YMR2_9BACL|nr:DinB family protein [Brevibacillus reuszeri]KNB69455.1 PadR family transcriptional regulator [Brevibacillus reuszeri]MED1861572.1 DinB family protein [Brevibacillus reuszeri]GED70892.1 PadR family transcriptional regulator [Brevibacillus reuszeri]
MDHYEENLSKTREQLLLEISSVRAEDFNRRLEQDKWSIAQVCHHLVIIDTLFAKAIVHGLKRMNPTNTEFVPIEFVADRSNKIQAPEITEPSSEPFQVQQIIQMLHDSRQNFLDVLSKVEDRAILKTVAVTHPVLGHLPLDQWVELLYVHEQRHIEQIQELKARCVI